MSLSMSVLRDGRSRSVSPENPAGGKGADGGAATGTGAAAARDLGPGWKVSPSVEIAAGGTHTVAEVAGPGVIRHMWLAVNPHGGLNSYWEMPFRSQARVTLENLGQAPMMVYYQVDYELTEVPEAAGYLH